LHLRLDCREDKGHPRVNRARLGTEWGQKERPQRNMHFECGS
jgi:hypothetical protein